MKKKKIISTYYLMFNTNLMIIVQSNEQIKFK